MALIAKSFSYIPSLCLSYIKQKFSLYSTLIESYIQHFSKKQNGIFRSALNKNLSSSYTILKQNIISTVWIKLLKIIYKAVIAAIEPNITPGKFATTIG